MSTEKRYHTREKGCDTVITIVKLTIKYTPTP